MQRKNFLLVLAIVMLSSFVIACFQSGPNEGPGYLVYEDENLNHEDYGSAEVFYPDPLVGDHPAVTLSGGWTNTKEQMEWIAIEMVQRDFIVLSFTPDNVLGGNPTWERGHKAALQVIEKENARIGSPIRGMVDTNKLGMVGFSKGGGGVLWVANDNDTKAKTLVAMSPWMWGTIITDAGINTGEIKIPVFMYTGTLDELAWGDGVREMYDGLPDLADRLYIDFNGVDHFVQFGGSDAADNNAREKCATYIIAWLKLYLAGDLSYQTYIKGAKRDYYIDEDWFYHYWFNDNKIVDN